MIKAVFCWSGGKDSSYCLHKVQKEGIYEVCYLLTTVNGTFKRISMHGVREELLDIQVKAIGIPLIKVKLSEGSNEEYEVQMERALFEMKAEGITHVIFGDIFLEDLRAYRESKLKQVHMTAVFPLWKTDTSALVQDFLAEGFKTVTCCISDEYLSEDWAGKDIDQAFIRNLPQAVDPCGENGEYHTFCYAGPLFKNEIKFTTGEKVYRPLEVKSDEGCGLPFVEKNKGFWFCDLIPV